MTDAVTGSFTSVIHPTKLLTHFLALQPGIMIWSLINMFECAKYCFCVTDKPQAIFAGCKYAPVEASLAAAQSSSVLGMLSVL